MEAALFQGAFGTYLSAAAASVLAGFVSAVSGMGGGVIVAAFAAQIFGMKATVPLMGIYMLMNNLSRLYFFRASFDMRAVRIVLVAAVPMSFVGARIYLGLDAAVIPLVLGTVLILSIPLRRLGTSQNLKLGGWGLALAGAAIGLLSATTVGTGALLIAALLGAGLVGPALLAARSGIGIGLGTAKVAAFALFGLLNWQIAVGGVLMGLCTIPGAAMGAWLVKRTNIRVHTLLMDAIVLASAATFLYEGVTRL